jgi:hypothetical protein
MKENSPIWARLAERQHDEEGRDRFADQDDEERGDKRPWLADHAGGIEQHPDRDEEQDGEGVAQRQRFIRRALAERRFAQDHAGKECAQRERDAEQLGRPEGYRQRDRQHAEPEQFPRTRVRDVVQDPRDEAPTDHEHQADEDGHLDDGQQQQTGQAQVEAELVCDRIRNAGAVADALQVGQRGEQDQRQHHRQVFDDQPSDRDPAALGFHQPPFPDRA